jgi:hypothetical protein
MIMEWALQSTTGRYTATGELVAVVAQWIHQLTGEICTVYLAGQDLRYVQETDHADD